MNVILFVGEEESQLKVLLRKVRLHNTDSHCDCPQWCYVQDLPIWRLLQSEDDCAGHETTRYTFFIDGREVGNVTADMSGLRSFSKSGDVAEVTLSVPMHRVSSSLFNLTVVLSNTVEFTEMIISSSNGVSSVLRSNTWYTTSKPYYCECKFDPHGTVCSSLAPSDNMACTSFECA